VIFTTLTRVRPTQFSSAPLKVEFAEPSSVVVGNIINEEEGMNEKKALCQVAARVKQKK
jgi:hypothetical protein